MAFRRSLILAAVASASRGSTLKVIPRTWQKRAPGQVSMYDRQGARKYDLRPNGTSCWSGSS